MNRLSFVFATAAISFSALTASAETSTISFGDSIDSMVTNWDDALELSLFDPRLGELCEVKITLLGDVTGSASYESLDAAPANISLNLSATIELTRPDNSLLVQVVPLVNVADSASAFDGVIDFGGTSGNTFDDLAGDAMDMVVLTDPADLALFVGLGTISLPVSAAGASTATGAGNIVSQFSTFAGAGAEILYTYKPVPEPTSIALIGLGVAGVLASRRFARGA